MSKPTDIRLVEATCQTESFDYRTPIKFGGRAVADATLLHVTVEVETRDGRRGKGFGSMPMGNIWGWPSQAVPAEATLSAMVELGRRLVQKATDYDGLRSPAGNHPRLGP